jgi:hypothetical protein
MAELREITINFNFPFNVSLQVGSDIVYYKDDMTGDIVRMGKCIAKTSTSITCQISSATPPPDSTNDYVFFVKSEEANTSGIIGYAAEVDMEITSPLKKEMFAVSSEVFISS